MKTPFWKHQDWFTASLPVISKSENRIYFAVNFGGNCRLVAKIKTRYAPENVRFAYRQFCLRLVTLYVGLIEFFIRPFEKRDILSYGVWHPSVNFFVSG